MKALLATTAAIALLAAPALAQDRKPPVDAKSDKPDAAIPPPKVVVTRHVGTFGGQKVAYTATIGETYLKDDKTGEPQAAIVSTSYVKDGRDPNRPVLFLFNGGPGSGSVWLHWARSDPSGS